MQRSQNSEECKTTYFGVKSCPFKERLNRGTGTNPFSEGTQFCCPWTLHLSGSSRLCLLWATVAVHCNITGTHSHHPGMNQADATFSIIRRCPGVNGLSVEHVCYCVERFIYPLACGSWIIFLDYSIIMLIILNFAVAMKCTTWLTTQQNPPSSEQVDMLLSHFTHVSKTGETLIRPLVSLGATVRAACPAVISSTVLRKR